jgi:hypothetical protein
MFDDCCLCNFLNNVCLLQVMETKNMIYIVSEYASQGEIFGKWTSWET